MADKPNPKQQPANAPKAGAKPMEQPKKPTTPGTPPPGGMGGNKPGTNPKR